VGKPRRSGEAMHVFGFGTLDPHTQRKLVVEPRERKKRERMCVRDRESARDRERETFCFCHRDLVCTRDVHCPAQTAKTCSHTDCNTWLRSPQVREGDFQNFLAKINSPLDLAVTARGPSRQSCTRVSSRRPSHASLGR